MVTPILCVSILVGSSVHLNSELPKKEEFGFPTGMTAILKDKAAQAELTNYNYLTSYRSLSNVLGFLGDTHWVGKAPNDILLGTRMDKEMRIICFASDALCAPKSPQIQNDVLARYSLKVYQSPITTAQYAALKPLDRFYADMDAVGQARFEVPDRFVGGNPLLKPNT